MTSLPEDNLYMRILSHDEEQVYLAAASPMLRALAELMLATGMRPNEVCHLEKGDVDLVRRTVTVKRGKTANARRTIPLTARAVAVLEMRMSAVRGKYLFPNPQNPNLPAVKLNNGHAAALKRSGIVPRFRLYDLRHTFASRAAMAGCDLATLGSLLGHSKVTMTMRYTHPSAQHQAAAIGKLEQFNAAASAALEAKPAKDAGEPASPHKSGHTPRLQ